MRFKVVAHIHLVTTLCERSGEYFGAPRPRVDLLFLEWVVALFCVVLWTATPQDR